MKRLLLLVALVLPVAGVVVAGQMRNGRLGVGETPQVTPAPSDAFFDDSAIHEIFLNINSRDWQALREHYLENTYYPCDFRWRDQVVRNVGIRSRGNGSRSGVKPGLRVDFDRYTTGQTFLGLKSFILRNNTQDPSNMHERLSMLLFRRMGVPASREAHTKLYINNQYAGLYTLVESVDKLFLQRTFNEDGGYLFKYDYPADAQPYYFEDRGPNPESYVPLPFKPETNETDPKPEVVVDLVRTINQSSDAVFRTAMADFIDLVKFVRFVAVERYLTDTDGFLSDWGGMNNYYMYRFDKQKLFTFIAWDKSNAFDGGVGYPIFHNITEVPSTQQNRLLGRAIGYSDLRTAYLDTLMECARSANELLPQSADPRGWLEREVERESSQIRDAALSDPQRTYTNEQFEQAVSDLRSFARLRGEYLTREVSAARGQP